MSALCACRYEVLPFRSSEEQAAEIATPLQLTVTVSPKHGIDRSVDHALRLRALGHHVTLHLAARAVESRHHLEAILARAAEGGIGDMLVIGGDLQEPRGPYSSAGELLDDMSGHPLRPAAIGVAAYPEGHPLIDDRRLDAALEHKAQLASYMVTQICFDPDRLLAWLKQVRENGVALPLYAGATGQVDQRRLLEISVRVGVGQSLRFLRKQGGSVGQLLRGPRDAAQRFCSAVDTARADPELGIAGFHFFTFNELVATWRWQQRRCAHDDRPAVDAGSA
jgi:methylenetetrahydrofolate reductase (NADPH)